MAKLSPESNTPWDVVRLVRQVLDQLKANIKGQIS